MRRGPRPQSLVKGECWFAATMFQRAQVGRPNGSGMLKGILLVVVLGYAAIVALAYVMQRSLMYFPDCRRVPPSASGLPQAEERVLKTVDHEEVIAWHVAPQANKSVVLYFHGNGGSVSGRAPRFK